MNRLQKCGVIPVVKIDDAKNAVPLAKALLSGELDCMEITFRTDAAADAIRNVRAECPEMHVGAGTVINTEQVHAAHGAGAGFIVSPGLDAEVVKTALSLGLPMIPGAVTPTEVMAAVNLGLTVVKIFPAESFGGLKTLKSLAAPFPHIRFMPTGGIGEHNAREYLAFEKVIAVGGSWMISDNLEKVAQLSKSAADLVREVRKI